MKPWAALAVATLAAPAVQAADLPSFLREGNAFCTDETAFDQAVAHGYANAGSAIPTCQIIDRPTRVAVMRGQGGVKSLVLVMNGPYAYAVGWTNAVLPVVPSR